MKYLFDLVAAILLFSLINVFSCMKSDEEPALNTLEKYIVGTWDVFDVLEPSNEWGYIVFYKDLLFEWPHMNYVNVNDDNKWRYKVIDGDSLVLYNYHYSLGYKVEWSEDLDYMVLYNKYFDQGIMAEKERQLKLIRRK